MKNPVWLTLALAVIGLAKPGIAQDDRISIQRMFENGYGGVLRALGKSSTKSGQDLVEKLVDVATDGDALVKAAAEATKASPETITYVPYAKWTGETLSSLPKGRRAVTVSVTGAYGRDTIVLEYTLKLYPENPATAPGILSKLNERFTHLIAPTMKKTSKELFDELYASAFSEVAKANESAESTVVRLEDQRKDLQLRSYDELPYEKVADHLADLQRQVLALQLSLAGMDAKDSEIKKQLAILNERLHDRADQAAKEAASSETLDALKQLVALREKNVDRLKELNKAGLAAPQGEIDEATARVLETKIQLFALQGKRQSPPHSDQLDNLEAERTRLAIDRTEQKAKLEFLAKTCNEVQLRIARRADLDQDIKRIDEQLPSAKAALRTAQGRSKDLADAKAAFRPIDLTKND